MLKDVSGQKNQIRSVIVWQLIVLSIATLIAGFFVSRFLDVAVGGILVILSTWHVHRSVYSSGGERLVLLKSAGLRFVFFLMAMGLCVVLLSLQPLYLVVGMAVSYAAMYGRSLMMIFKQMKGDGVG